MSTHNISARTFINICDVIIKKQINDDIYNIYITDSVKIIGENIAKLSGGGYLTKKYSEIISNNQNPQKTPKEIIACLEKSGAIKVKRKEV